jgi:hypothetical protein
MSNRSSFFFVEMSCQEREKKERKNEVHSLLFFFSFSSLEMDSKKNPKNEIALQKPFFFALIFKLGFKKKEKVIFFFFVIFVVVFFELLLQKKKRKEHTFKKKIPFFLTVKE